MFISHLHIEGELLAHLHRHRCFFVLGCSIQLLHSGQVHILKCLSSTFARVFLKTKIVQQNLKLLKTPDIHLNDLGTNVEHCIEHVGELIFAVFCVSQCSHKLEIFGLGL